MDRFSPQSAHVSSTHAVIAIERQPLVRAFAWSVVLVVVMCVAGCTPARQTGGHAHTHEQPAPTKGSGMWYVVTDQDTMSSVAKRSGLRPTEIVRANDVQGGLKPGMRIWLPGVLRLAPPAKPAAPTYAYTLISRAEWGAAEMRANHDPMNGVKRITIHHTSDIPGMGEGRTDRELVQAVQKFHQDTNGWADIGYHFLIAEDGQVYEGRPITCQGAHAGGTNNLHNLGISLIGDFNLHDPTPAQLKSLENLVRHMQQKFAIPNTAVFGHKDLGPTECPGKHLYEWLEAFRAR